MISKDCNANIDVSKYNKGKSLALFFTAGVSLKTWNDIGMIDREVAIYNKMSNNFENIFLFTYGDEKDLKYVHKLADNIIVVPKKKISNNILYSILLPFIHRDILKKIDILKTNQMMGSWSAVLSKIFNGNKLVIRTGYMLSINWKKENKGPFKKFIAELIEKIAYKNADGIITTSESNFEYVESKYSPNANHITIPNYVDTETFKPMNFIKEKNSICFVGRLSPEKNIFGLLDAIEGYDLKLTIIGSGKLEDELKKYVVDKKINVDFLGNIPNKELPTFLNSHELFILPSFFENMPKSLLEAMGCGLPVIGTNVKGIKEVIVNEVDGILCETDSDSLRNSLTELLNNNDLKKKLSSNAILKINEKYSLDSLYLKELNFLESQ